MLGSSNGAQRASSRSHVRPVVGLLLGLSLAGSLAAAPSVGATTASTVPVPTATTLMSPVARPWYSAETYYLSLVNCTRTGGWVLRDGTCRGYGSGRYSAYVRPLSLSAGISNRVTRPYARLLAYRAICSHVLDHDPGFRLRRAGFRAWTWGENIGCRDGYPAVRAAILASHLVFQAERSTNGGHWRNIKNSRYTYIGIGIWSYGNRTRLVTDFYRA